MWAARWYEALVAALEQFLLPRVILGSVIDEWPERVPSADYVQLYVHRDATPEDVASACKVWWDGHPSVERSNVENPKWPVVSIIELSFRYFLLGSQA